MAAKFANYSAFSEASRQVSQEMKKLHKSFDTAKQNSQVTSKRSSSGEANTKTTVTPGKAIK
jgi:hypothetical protein